MSLRAKFVCQSVTRTPGADDVKFTAVTAARPENKTWAQYTPNGALNLTITNPGAMSAFEPGEEYLVTLAKAAP